MSKTQTETRYVVRQFCVPYNCYKYAKGHESGENRFVRWTKDFTETIIYTNKRAARAGSKTLGKREIVPFQQAEIEHYLHPGCISADELKTLNSTVLASFVYAKQFLERFYDDVREFDNDGFSEVEENTILTGSLLQFIWAQRNSERGGEVSDRDFYDGRLDDKARLELLGYEMAISQQMQAYGYRPLTTRYTPE